MDDWLAWTVKAAIWIILMSLAMGWLGRTRLVAGGGASPMRMRQPRSMLLVSLGGAVFFVGLAVLSNVYVNETRSLLATAVFLGFALLSLAAVVSFFVERHGVSAQGLELTTLCRGRVVLPWADIARVRYSPLLRAFSIRARDGAGYSVSAALMGLPLFAEIALAQLAPGALDDEARAALEATAAGDLPPLWG